MSTPSTDVAVRNGRDVTIYDTAAGTLRVPTPFGGGVLEFAAGQRVLTPEQMVLLAPLGIEAGWDPRVVATFLSECHERGLDPWQREAYLMLYAGKFIRHVGIDGFRKRGESTGEYRGRLGPYYCDSDEKWREIWPRPDRPPVAAKVGLLRAGFDGPVWAVAMYDEYVPMQDETKWDPRQNKKTKTGRKVPTSNWRCAAEGGKPSVMLGKVAEAQAWRAAFPARFGGFYAPEELEHARAGDAAEDPGAATRKAAYVAAQEAAGAAGRPVGADAQVVGEPVRPEAATQGPVFDVPDDDARRLLLAELDEQAEVLGRSAADLCVRWSASRDGRGIDTATLPELADHVHRVRPYVLAALRDADRDEEADRYERAPAAATVHDLFGRGPAMTEPPAGTVDGEEGPT